MSIPKIPKFALPGQSRAQMPNSPPTVTMNPQVFQHLIEGHGIRMIHAKPIPCPNVRDLKGLDHDPSCNSCHNGYLYYGSKPFIGVFMGNTNTRKFQVQGTWDYDNAQIIIPTQYEDGTEMDVQIFDQVIVPDFTVRYYQRVQHSQTGIDRLHFPAIAVDKVVGSTGQEYAAGSDVIVNSDGRLEWIGPNRPGFDPVLYQGDIYSVNYYIRPVFTVVDMPHQLRATQEAGPGATFSPLGAAAPFFPGFPLVPPAPPATQDNQTTAVNNVQARFPQLIIVRKDYLPFDTKDHVGAPDTPEPRDGSTGG